MPSGSRKRSLRVDERLLRKARRALRTASDSEAVTRALEEAVANREIEASLLKLLREGRGHFVDVYGDQR